MRAIMELGESCDGLALKKKFFSMGTCFVGKVAVCIYSNLKGSCFATSLMCVYD